MPKLEEYCEVRTEGGVFREWTSVAVSITYEKDWMRTFNLTCAEPNVAGKLRLMPGDRVDIALAGKVLIKEGYIVHRQAAYDANRHAVQVQGYSKAGPINEASVMLGAEGGGGQFRNYSLEQIANAVLKPHGIKFRLENAPKSAELPFPNVILRDGETPAELIGRLAKQRGVFVIADTDGNLVGGAGSNKGTTTLAEGVNILAANCFIEYPWVDRVIATSQQQGSDSLFGRKAAEVQATAQIVNGDKGKARVVVSDAPLSMKETQARADREAADIARATLRVTITHQGWLKPGSQDLWTPGELVTVRSPMLFPVGDGTRSDLKVIGIQYQQSNELGTITTIELVSLAAFALSRPDANKPDPYNIQGRPAQPDDT